MPKLFVSSWKLNDLAVRDVLKDMHKTSYVFNKNQYDSWYDFLVKVGAGSEAIQSAKSVALEQSLAIISGQQIGIGISPILSLSKIFTIEALSNELSKKLGQNIKPVFWLQTEDHDISEISKIGILDTNFKSHFLDFKDYILKSNKRTDERSSVGSLKVYSLGSELISQFKDLMSQNNLLTTESQELFLKQFSESYSGNKTLSESFANFYYSLFPNSSVCFFDIRYKELNSLKSKVFKKALADMTEIEKILEATELVLLKDGVVPKVKIKKSSPLFFYHPEGFDSSRYRIDLDKSDSLVIPDLDQVFSKNIILKEIQTSPEKFSSSALLRPLLQDSIFNTLIYVGGPSEIDYLKQIKDLYSFFKINKPIHLLRPSIVILDDKSSMHMNDMNFEIDNLFEGEDISRNRVLESRIDPKIRGPHILDQIKKNQIQELIKVLDNLSDIDKTLLKPKNKTYSYIEKSITKFLGKYDRALLNSNKILSDRLDRLISQCYPLGQNQERTISVLSLGLMYGSEVFNEMREEFNKLIFKVEMEKK